MILSSCFLATRLARLITPVLPGNHPQKTKRNPKSGSGFPLAS
jgi:hypothetical protein